MPLQELNSCDDTRKSAREKKLSQKVLIDLGIIEDGRCGKCCSNLFCLLGADYFPIGKSFFVFAFPQWHVDFIVDPSQELNVKLHFESDGRKKIGCWKSFKLVKSESFDPSIEEEVLDNGFEEIVGGTLISKNDMKIGLNCFALWPQNGRNYRAIIVDILGKKAIKKKRSGIYMIYIM